MGYGSSAAGLRGDTPPLPAWDKRVLTYVGTTNNAATIVYSLGGNPVATRTLTYIGNGAADNDKVATEVVTTPQVSVQIPP